MSYEAVPVGLRTLKAGSVAVLISPRAAKLLPLRPGWQAMTRERVRSISDVCEAMGQADRRNPKAPGVRIALQGLSRHIRHRLAQGVKP